MARRDDTLEAVCARWAHTRDASARVVRAPPAHGIALRLRGGHDAVLSLPGWAARGAAAAEDDTHEGLELRLYRGGAATSRPPLLLHARAVLSGETAVLFDARDAAATAAAEEPDAASRWLDAAQARLWGELPRRADALARLSTVLDALWEASEPAALDELFARAAAAEAAEAAAARAAAQVARVQGEELEVVLSIALRHARHALSLVDVLACRETCVAWCRAASEPACFACLALPPRTTPDLLRAWLRLAAGDSVAWKRVRAAAEAAGALAPARGVRALDASCCETLGYAELLPAVRAAAPTLTSLRLYELACVADARRPGIIVMPSQLAQLAAAAPALRQVRVCSVRARSLHQIQDILGLYTAWAQAEGARGVELTIEALSIDLSAHWLSGPRTSERDRRSSDFLASCSLAEQMCATVAAALKLSAAATRTAAMRVAVRLPARLRALAQPTEAELRVHAALLSRPARVTAAQLAERCERLRVALQFGGDARLQLEMV
jgi:hypothetical protein